MKKFVFGFACALAGGIVGAAIPHVVAQTAPTQVAPMGPVTRWQQMCEVVDTDGREGAALERLSQVIAQRGLQGWELVEANLHIHAISYPCFKRPASQ